MGQNVSALPRCSNDIEWDCVCEMLGYNATRDPVSRYVPMSLQRIELRQVDRATVRLMMGY